MTGPTNERLYLNERYVPERALGNQTPGRFLVAVDSLAGGRVTVMLPHLHGVTAARFIDMLAPEIIRLGPLAETAYCTLKDAGLTPNGEAFVVINRPQGSSLAGVLRAEGRVQADRALSIAVQLCDLVRRAHAVGVCPTSLEPESLILDPLANGRTRVSVVDLGLTRGVFGPAVRVPRHPSPYESPQIRQGEPGDPRDDVFAIAAVVHAMILGVAPPEMSAHGPADGSGWPALPDDGRALDRRLVACLHTVLLKGLAPERGERFPNVGALQRALIGLRQLMQLSAPAFELLAAARGRLGQGPDALDLRSPTPEMERAAEARARIRQVVSSSKAGPANLSALEEQMQVPSRVTGAVSLATGSMPVVNGPMRTGDFEAVAPPRAEPAPPPGTQTVSKPLVRLPLVRRLQSETR